MNPVQFLENLAKLKVDDLDSVKGFGPILASNLINFTESERFEVLLQKFKELEKQNIEINIINQNTIKPSTGPLLGQTICITGTFEKPREEIKAYLSSFGASMTDSVTKKTTILLVGDEPGSKVEKARGLGIEIIESLAELESKYKLV
jgi:DNA ligase (NAD+)